MIEKLWDGSLLIRLVGLVVVYFTISVVVEHIRIKRLGARAKRVWGILPFGMDLAWTIISSSLHYKDQEFWDGLFSHVRDRQSKTIEMTMARRRYIFTADPENIKAILATQFDDYGKGETFHEEWKDFLGDSIFTTDGDMWRESRNLLRPQFIKTRVSDLETFEKHVSELIGKLGGKGQEVNIRALFFSYALDTTTDFLLGHSVGSLNNPQAKFTEAFAELQRIQNLVSRVGPFHHLIPRRTFWAGLKVLNDFVNQYIERALRLDPSELERKTKSTQGYTFLHAIAGFTRDRKVLRDQIVAVLLAGRDTTAGTLSFCFKELSRHPRIVAKLRREILDRVGLQRRPTYEDLKNMPYLQHTINETLRMYPSVAANVRLALHNTTLPHGGGPDGLQPIGILKNTPIAYSTICMQRDPKLFPPPSAEFPDILRFHPERWDNWTPKPWTYVPFNGGPRICIGQQFAITEIGYTIVRILQRFERIDKYWQDGDEVLNSEIVLSPANGVKVGFWESSRQGEAKF